MGNPFQDQLLKAGLVSKKQANKVKHEKHIGRKKNKKKNPSAISSKAREEQLAMAERTRELNQKKSAAKQEREQKAQIKQLIEQNRLECDDRGEPYHFVKQNKIERIFISEEMIEQLSRGQLAIVALGDSYEVVPAKVARQIRNRDTEAVLAFHEGQKA